MENYFETIVNVPRIKHGKNQTIETLINEESFLFAKFLREEAKNWSPRKAKIKTDRCYVVKIQKSKS